MKFLIPVKTVSEANMREHWAVKAKRAKHQRWVAKLMTTREGNNEWEVGAYTIRLTRMGVRALDSDNLARSNKAIRDGIADALGMDDGDSRLVWEYDQQKCKRGEFGVIVEISPC